MNTVKRIFKKIIFPKAAVVWISVPLAVILMIFVYGFGHRKEPIACVAFAGSAYSMIILIAWCAVRIKAKVSELKAHFRKYAIVDKYFSDVKFKTLVSLYLSAASNTFYAVTKLFMGIFYHSVWICTLAVYYILLTIMRYFLLSKKQNRKDGDVIAELKKYRICAVVILLMNSALTGMVVLAIHHDEGSTYNEILIYVIAMYDFYMVISSIKNLIQYRKYKNPVISATKVISFATSLISMLSLEMSMFAQFDTTGSDEFKNTMLAATGGVICIIFITSSVYMIVKSTKKIKSIQGT